ncbi:MAG: hypothetical protein ACRCXL_00210 [Dermatophilaceae bacterium]
MTTRHARGIGIVVVLLVIGVAGCAGDDGVAEPSPTLAVSPTPADAGPPAGFLTRGEEPRPLATTAARDESSYSGATFSIVSVETDARSTLVVWSATHPRTLSAGADFDVRAWRNFPVLTSKTQAFSVLTYETSTGAVECVCVDMQAMRAEPNPQGALYPPLPKGVTSVRVTSPWFAEVTVPVTRR